MAHQKHQYSYRNIDDSSIWAAKSIYLVNSTLLLKMSGIYGNLMKLQKMVEFHHFSVSTQFLVDLTSKYLCKRLGIHRFSRQRVVEHGNSDSHCNFQKTALISGNRKIPQKYGKSSGKVGTHDFHGNVPKNHLYSLGNIGVFAICCFCKKSVFAEKWNSARKSCFLVFCIFSVKSAILRKTGSRAPGTPKSR